MTKQAMVADRDAQPASEVPDNEQNRLNPRHTKLGDVIPQTGDSGDWRQHQKQRVDDVDAVVSLPCHGVAGHTTLQSGYHSGRCSNVGPSPLERAPT